MTVAHSVRCDLRRRRRRGVDIAEVSKIDALAGCALPTIDIGAPAGRRGRARTRAPSRGAPL